LAWVCVGLSSQVYARAAVSGRGNACQVVGSGRGRRVGTPLGSSRRCGRTLICRCGLLRPLVGGQIGAALVALPSGESAVLSSWPGVLGARARAVAAMVARLRVRGYPAPEYLAVIDCETTTAVLQEFV